MIAQDQTRPWPAPEVLEENRQRLLREMQEAMRRYELRYELRSDDLEHALTTGRIRETWEVCEWLFAIHTYRALQPSSRMA